jgi:hypothetical protein
VKRRDFCTYFDHRYFARGLALHESLLAHCPGARLWVLCLSDECFSALTRLALPGLVPVRLADFEAGNAALAAAKANRSTIEYYFTCTPSLLDWVLKQDAAIETITYLDSDLFFFSDPEPIFSRFDGYSSLIIEHRFAPPVKALEVYGRYNVGWVSFRRDADGLACLAWWRDRCLEWCYDVLEGDRFADQKYLERFSELFRGVLILDHPGANLAPWNLASHRLEESASGTLVDGEPLLFFHFHRFRQLLPWVWQTHHRDNGAAYQGFLARRLYRPYIRALRRAAANGLAAGIDTVSQLQRGHDVRGPLAARLRALAKIFLYRDFVIQIRAAR